jgi:peptidoglycan/xylan/chitin deacetylase (PgdA/CDA1 family)
MKVALTIDAEHPDMPVSDPLGNAHSLLDVLGDAGVRTTFFVQSKWAAAHAELPTRVVQEGHLIASHSHSHCVFPHLTAPGVLYELEESRRILERFAPTANRFRFPRGQGAGDETLEQLLAQAGYRHIAWHCGGNDWQPGTTAAEVANPIVNYVRSYRQDVTVVLVHSWPDPTPEAVSQVLTQLRDEVEWVTLDEIPESQWL